VLKSDGTVGAFGSSYQGVTNVPPGLSNVIAIAAGMYHNLALKSDGTLVRWGQLYLGPPSDVPAGLSNVVAIAAGGQDGAAQTVPLSIESFSILTNGTECRFHTFSGRQYSVEYSPTINPSSWLGLPGGPIQGDGQDRVATDLTGWANMRFYRLKELH
jgi:hypothetical protein